jgi:hypothetical protein
VPGCSRARPDGLVRSTPRMLQNTPTFGACPKAVVGPKTGFQKKGPTESGPNRLRTSPQSARIVRVNPKKVRSALGQLQYIARVAGLLFFYLPSGDRTCLDPPLMIRERARYPETTSDPWGRGLTRATSLRCPQKGTTGPYHTHCPATSFDTTW